MKAAFICLSEQMPAEFTEATAKPRGKRGLNNNSGIDVVSLSDGSLVLVSNPIGENWGDRSPLTLMRSFDGGKTFEEFYKLESKIGDFEFSYPAITAVNKKLYITYTYERKTIKYAEIEIY